MLPSNLYVAAQHIPTADLLALHCIACRFEAVWGWALQQLGLPLARCRHLSAVLAVPIDMTAAEVGWKAFGEQSHCVYSHSTLTLASACA